MILIFASVNPIWSSICAISTGVNCSVVHKSMTRHVRLNPPTLSTTGILGEYGGYGLPDMDINPNKPEEEEVPLDDGPLDQSHPVPRIPIIYEDSDDYGPFDTDSEET